MRPSPLTLRARPPWALFLSTCSQDPRAQRRVRFSPPAPTRRRLSYGARVRGQIRFPRVPPTSTPAGPAGAGALTPAKKDCIGNHFRFLRVARGDPATGRRTAPCSLLLPLPPPFGCSRSGLGLGPPCSPGGAPVVSVWPSPRSLRLEPPANRLAGPVETASYAEGGRCAALMFVRSRYYGLPRSGPRPPWTGCRPAALGRGQSVAGSSFE